MKKLILLLSLTFLGVACCLPAFAGSAFSTLYGGTINNELAIPETTPTPGAATVVSLNLVSETPGGYWGNIWTTAGNGGNLALGATIGQPTVALSQNSPAYTWTGWAMCIDSLHTIGYGAQTSNYAAYNFTPSGTYINSNIHTVSDWYKLTNMFTNANVTSDQDRAALQLATWKGVQGDWNTGRSDFWATYGSTNGFRVTGGNASLLFGKAEEYLAWGNAYTGSTEVGNFKILRDTTLQMFAINTSSESLPLTQIPEPGTIVAAMVLLTPVGFMFRRRLA